MNHFPSPTGAGRLRRRATALALAAAAALVIAGNGWAPVPASADGVDELYVNGDRWTSSEAVPARKVTGDTTLTFAWTTSADASRFDVRFRLSAPGTTAPWTQRTVPADGPRFLEVVVPPSRTACFQRRTVDTAGTPQAWQPMRCLVLDGSAPRMTRAEVTPTWFSPKHSGVIQYEPSFSYAADDESGIGGYQVQMRAVMELPENRLADAGIFPSETQWSRATTTTIVIGPAAAACFRARALDGVGWVSAWSAWRCSSSPLDPSMGWGRHSLVASIGRGNVSMVEVFRGGRYRTAQSNEAYGASGIRLRVRKGRHLGKAKVYLGQRYLGTISGRAKRAGWKWVTLTTPTIADGRFRLVAATKAPTLVGEQYVLY